MALNDAIILDAPILVGQQKADSSKYDNGGEPLGWSSITQVQDPDDGLPVGLRYAGLTIKINGIEYWWAPDLTVAQLSNDPTIKMIPSSSYPDGLISGGNIDISDFSSGNITVGAAQWLLTIGGTQEVYQSPTPTLFSGIGLSSTGNQRYVAFFGDFNGDIIKVEGTQSPAAVMPATPANTVPIGHVLITDSIIEPPVVDLTGFAKLNADNIFTAINRFRSQLISESDFIANNILIGQSSISVPNIAGNYSLTKANTNFRNPDGGDGSLASRSVVGTNFEASFLYVSNNSGADVILKHNSGVVDVDRRFILPNEEDYLLKNGEYVALTKQVNYGYGYCIFAGNLYPSGNGGFNIDTLPVYNLLQDLYDAILSEEITLGKPYKGNGALLYVTQQDIDNSAGGVTPNPPTNGVVDDINKTFTFTESI